MVARAGPAPRHRKEKIRDLAKSYEPTPHERAALEAYPHPGGGEPACAPPACHGESHVRLAGEVGRRSAPARRAGYAT
jgi:hypothetical protein